MAPERTVSVFLQRPIDADRKLLSDLLSRAKLEAHSGSFRRFLSGWEVENEEHREVTLPTGAPAGLRHVLGIIQTHGGKENLFINVAGMTVTRAVAIWEACDLLDMQPKSATEKLMGHICWTVAHEKVSREVMEKVDTVFCPSICPEDPDRRRPWDTMVHQYAWDLVHGLYTLEEQEALEALYQKLPELSAAIAIKEPELRAKKQLHDEHQALNMKRNSGSARRKAARARKDKAKLLEEAEDVKAGLKEWRPELEPYLRQTWKTYGKSAKPTTYGMDDVQSRKSAKKVAAGRSKLKTVEEVAENWDDFE
ncbi:uncharacterized protein RCC_08802 [Ramularia collo-cygni]|uniref:BTB domain-containing protein n=1 Tax=Ramularia collo-cygni TaxID=112498 RepID=A0A2D3VDG2_9PEZI|nr:uncharacterized protein RCC_08802 [Ramularia collo-cygni]CZT23092.1 uncharacterized protein RCC_08802 [Ramularia collo-cygni]